MVVITNGKDIEVINFYEYFGTLTDDSVHFKLHVLYLVKKVRLKFEFLLSKQVVYFLLPELDYGDLLCVHASARKSPHG